MRVLAPKNGNLYYRLTWVDPVTGKPDDTSGGRTLETAMAKAAKKDLNLQADRIGVQRDATVGGLVDAFGLSGKARGHKGADASDARMEDVCRILVRATKGQRDVKTAGLDRMKIDAMRAQAGTPATVRENTTALRLLLGWGARTGRLHPTMGELLPERAQPVDPKGPRTAASTAPKRRKKPRVAGSTLEFASDAPDLDAVVALREEVQRLQPRWGALAVELAGGCGSRWSEEFQLTAYDVLVTESGLEIAINWQIDSKAKAGAVERRKLPKGEKTRVTTVPEYTQTGFALFDALLGRREAALAEQAAGTNPEALLFPTPTGRLYIHTNFHANVFKPAAITAGWPFQEWEAKETRTGRDGTPTSVARRRIQFDLTWHSLRHRYARFAIDVLHLTDAELTVQGGWEDVEIVRRRYYQSGEEHRVSAREKVHAAGRSGATVQIAGAAPAASRGTDDLRRLDQGSEMAPLDRVRLDLIARVAAGAMSLDVYAQMMEDIGRIDARGRAGV